MSTKFDVIIESAMRRFQGTNFLIGDRVKLADNYTSHEWTKAQPALKLERIKELIESGDNIRVSAVKAIRPATAQTGHFQDVDGFYVDIIREAAPGLFMSNQVFTIPQELLELQEDYPNLAGETPKGQIRKDTSHIDAKEVELDAPKMGADPTSSPDLHMTDKHVSISTQEPAKSYTTKYMEG